MTWFDPILTPISSKQLWDAHRLALGSSIASEALPGIKRSISLGNFDQEEFKFSNFLDSTQNIIENLLRSRGCQASQARILSEEDIEGVGMLFSVYGGDIPNVFSKNFANIAKCFFGPLALTSFRANYFSITDPNLNYMLDLADQSVIQMKFRF